MRKDTWGLKLARRDKRDPISHSATTSFMKIIDITVIIATRPINHGEWGRVGDRVWRERGGG